MEKIKDFCGKVIQADLQYSDGTIEKRVGVILNQEVNSETDVVKLTMLESSGRKTTFPARVSKLNQLKSVRLDAEERAAFQDTYKAYSKLQAFLNKYEEEKDFLEKELTAKMKHLRTFSDSLTFNDFSQLINKLFYEKFYERYGVSIEYSAGSKDIAIMSVTKNCGKWMDFDNIPFITKEYDGEYFVETQLPEHDEFCKKQGPGSISELESLYESSYEASVGDKRTLSISLNYRIPLKYGLTKSSIRDIEEQLNKAFMKNRNIDKKIEAASNQSSHKERQSKSKNAELTK